MLRYFTAFSYFFKKGTASAGALARIAKAILVDVPLLYGIFLFFKRENADASSPYLLLFHAITNISYCLNTIS